MSRKTAPLAAEYPPYVPEGPYGCVLIVCAIAGATVGWLAGTAILFAAGQFDTESGDTLSWIAVPVIAVGIGLLPVSLSATVVARLPARWGRPWQVDAAYLAALLLPGCAALTILFVMPEAWAIPMAALVIAAVAVLVVAWWIADSPRVRRWRRRLRPERPPVVRWSDPFEGYNFTFDLPDGWVAGDPTTLPGNLRAYQQDHPALAPTIDRLLERGSYEEIRARGTFAILVSSGDDDPPTMSLSRHPGAWYPEQDLDASVSNDVRSLEARREGEPSHLRGGKVRLRDVELPFGPAKLVCLEYVGTDLARRDYWFDQGTWRQSVGLFCRESVVEAMEPAFEQIVGSFRVKSPDNANLGRS